MCSGCSGDYCGGYEDDGLASAAENAAITEAADRSRPSQWPEAKHRATARGKAKACLMRLFRSLQLIANFPADSTTADHCAKRQVAANQAEEYEVLVSPTHIVEVRRTGLAGDEGQRIGSAVASAMPQQSARECAQERSQSDSSSAKHYRTSPRRRFSPFDERVAGAISLLIRALAAAGALLGALWLFSSRRH